MRRLAVLVASLGACSPASDPAAGGGGAGAGQATVTGSGGSGGGAGPATEPTRYPPGARHSPMSEAVIDRLEGVLAAAGGRPGVFAKIGDSITVSNAFLRCFAFDDVDLGAHGDLEATRAFFGATLADTSHTSYDRTTLAATVGWSASDVIAGDPTPLVQEVAAIDPAFAVVMLGTNDTYPQGVEPFDAALLAIVDDLLARGVVPLLSTIPPRGDTAEAEALVPEMNAVIRAVAQSRQVPLMDLFGALEPLAGYGLAGDGVHPQVYADATGVHGCWLTDAALAEGMNQRNLITLEALDRARSFLLDGGAAEPAPPSLQGSGTWEAPLVIDALPFADDRDTLASSASVAGTYACGTQDEGGPEIVYRITVDAPATLRARVFDAPGVDVDLHLLTAPGDPASCVARADEVLDADVGAGTYWIVADTFVAAGAPQAGPFRLTVVALP